MAWAMLQAAVCEAPLLSDTDLDSGNATESVIDTCTDSDDNVYDAYYDVYEYDTDLGPHPKAS